MKEKKPGKKFKLSQKDKGLKKTVKKLNLRSNL